MNNKKSKEIDSDWSEFDKFVDHILSLIRANLYN